MGPEISENDRMMWTRPDDSRRVSQMTASSKAGALRRWRWRKRYGTCEKSNIVMFHGAC